MLLNRLHGHHPNQMYELVSFHEDLKSRVKPER